VKNSCYGRLNSSIQSDLDTFAAVRKIYLSIFVCWSILLASLNAGSLSFQNVDPAPAQSLDGIHYSVSYSNLPHTDLELSSHQNSIARNISYRNQNYFGDPGAGSYSNNDPFYYIHQEFEDQTAHEVKQYLSNIYPSHNFW
jgi:hypothetical protein